MQLTKYRPLNTLQKRKRNSFIILSHMRNFSYRLDPLVPDHKGFLPYFTTNKIRNYYNKLNKPIPFHYHVNNIMKDWEILVSTPLNRRSTLLDSAFENGYIDYYYRDAIVIAIQDDFSLRTPDLRMYEVLGSNLIAPLKELFKIGNIYDSIVFIDEIFNIEKYNKDRKENPTDNKYPFEFRPMDHFDRVQFNLEITRFI